MAVSTATKPHQVYRLSDSTKVPGVTSILSTIAKPALYRWNNSLGLRGIDTSEYLNHVADAGTLAHSMIQSQLTGAEQDTSGYTQDQIRMAENALASFRAWARGKSVETLQMESPLVSETHRYGGTFDWYGLVDGTLTLIDFKTSSAIYDDHLYQLAGYFQLLTENGWEVAEALIVRLSRDAGEEFSERVLSVPELVPYWQVFKAALGLYTVIKLAKKRGARRW